MEDSVETFNSSTVWENCPLDVLLILFEYLSPKDLIVCFHVNCWWRNTVDYMGQRIFVFYHKNTWQSLAQAGIEDKGLLYKRRSTLSWRDLYFNSRLWNHLTNAAVSWNYILSAKNIESLDVCRDYLIVHVVKEDFLTQTLEMKCFKIDNDGESVSQMGCGKTELEENVDKMVKKIMELGPFKRLLMVKENCFYILYRNCSLLYCEWLEKRNTWTDLPLARYYGRGSTVINIFEYNTDVFIMLETGFVLRLDRECRLLEPLLIVHTQYRSVLTLPKTPSYKLDSDLKVPLSTGDSISFRGLSTLVSVPSHQKFKRSRSKSGAMIIEYPDLTCATQHGEVLLLGFRDGKIDIGLANKLTEVGEPDVRQYIQNCHGYMKENPEIVSIEAYEVEGSHRVFVATRSHVYQLVIRYAEHILSALRSGRKQES